MHELHREASRPPVVAGRPSTTTSHGRRWPPAEQPPVAPPLAAAPGETAPLVVPLPHMRHPTFAFSSLWSKASIAATLSHRRAISVAPGLLASHSPIERP